MNNKPAYSLVFAFLIMTVVMIVASTTIENTREKVIYFNEMEASSQARLAAESAAELAIVNVKDYLAGYEESEEEVFCPSAYATSSVSCDVSGDYTVYSLAAENAYDTSGAYYTPYPGTGTAAPSDQCSVTNTHEVPDHPCNWNKLLFGQSVTIPLYSDDGLGTAYLPTTDSGFTKFVLRMRTPCNDGTFDEGCTRYEFVGNGTDVDDDGEVPDDDPTVVFWQINGENSSGTVSLVPNDEVTPSRGVDIRDIITPLNSEIYESLINSAYSSTEDFIVLDSSDFSDIESTITDSTLTGELNLQLDIVIPLIDTSGNSIPYLEWQLLAYSSVPFGDTKATIVGEGYSEESSGTYYFPFEIFRNTSGGSTNIYTLSN